jgi:hypothetical protein
VSDTPELALGVKLPETSAYDLRGPSGPWIDYFRKTYPEWAKASDPRDARPRPWPKGFEPDVTPIFAHNEIVIAAPPARVFAALLDARSWSTYYENASKLELPAGVERLGPDVHFGFTTFGVAFSAQITLFEADQALGWTCTGGTPELSVHHRWLLEPEGSGTRLVTEETNYISGFGWLGPLARWFNQKLAESGTREALPAAHQRWLTELKRVVERNS